MCALYKRKKGVITMTNVFTNTTTSIIASYFWLANKEEINADKCVSVDPCGPKKYLKYAPLTPSAEFVTWGKSATPEEYKERFIAEVLSGLDVNQVAKDLAGKIILSAEGPKFKGNSPRKVIAEWLKKAGYECREYGTLTEEEKEAFWNQKVSERKEESVKAPTLTATVDPEVESIVAEIKAKMHFNKEHYSNAVAFQNVSSTALKSAVLNRLIKTSRMPVTILVDDGERKKKLTECAERTKWFEVKTPQFYFNNKGAKCYHPEDRPAPGSLVIVETEGKVNPKDLKVFAPGCWIVRVVATTPLETGNFFTKFTK